MQAAIVAAAEVKFSPIELHRINPVTTVINSGATRASAACTLCVPGIAIAFLSPMQPGGMMPPG
jgi:hypothetical protein